VTLVACRPCPTTLRWLAAGSVGLGAGQRTRRPPYPGLRRRRAPPAPRTAGQAGSEATRTGVWAIPATWSDGPRTGPGPAGSGPGSGLPGLVARGRRPGGT
jgi:hypothetical protein